jgi:hypothetical protein
MRTSLGDELGSIRKISAKGGEREGEDWEEEGEAGEVRKNLERKERDFELDWDKMEGGERGEVDREGLLVDREEPFTILTSTPDGIDRMALGSTLRERDGTTLI